MEHHPSQATTKVAKAIAYIIIFIYFRFVDVLVADLCCGVILLILANEFAARRDSKRIDNLLNYIRNLSNTLIAIAANESGGPLAASVMKDLAISFPSIGEADEAEALFRGAIAVCKEHLGEGHPVYTELLSHYQAFEAGKRKRGRKTGT